MNKEKWVEWIPVEETTGLLYLQELKYNNEGLQIILIEDENSKILTIHFDSVFAYRSIDEGDFLKTIYEKEKDTSKDSWSLFTVENSLYLNWFHIQSYNIHQNNEIIHYLIATPNEIVDILDSDVPSVKWSNS